MVQNKDEANEKLKEKKGIERTANGMISPGGHPHSFGKVRGPVDHRKKAGAQIGGPEHLPGAVGNFLGMGKNKDKMEKRWGHEEKAVAKDLPPKISHFRRRGTEDASHVKLPYSDA